MIGLTHFLQCNLFSIALIINQYAPQWLRKLNEREVARTNQVNKIEIYYCASYDMPLINWTVLTKRLVIPIVTNFTRNGPNPKYRHPLRTQEHNGTKLAPGPTVLITVGPAWTISYKIVQNSYLDCWDATRAIGLNIRIIYKTLKIALFGNFIIANTRFIITFRVKWTLPKLLDDFIFTVSYHHILEYADLGG